MRVLVTNDDGIEAPGIAALAGALVEAGHDVLVVAPLAEASGSGAATGPIHLEPEIAVVRSTLAGLEGTTAIAVAGTPALATMVGLSGIVGATPEVVVSGVNRGPNLGRLLLHSGTVGAAATALGLGFPALAVSLAVPSTDGAEAPFSVAAEAAAALVPWLASQPVGIGLNLNLPDPRHHPCREAGAGRLAPTVLRQARLVEIGPGRLRLARTGPPAPAAPGTDEWLVDHGIASLSAFRPPLAEADVDLAEPLKLVEEALARVLGPEERAR